MTYYPNPGDPRQQPVSSQDPWQQGQSAPAGGQNVWGGQGVQGAALRQLPGQLVLLRIVNGHVPRFLS